MDRGYVKFDGFDPRSAKEATFRLPRPLVDRVSRYAPAPKLADLYCVRMVAEEPAVAFRGIRRIDEELARQLRNLDIVIEIPDADGLCLAGVPRRRRTPEGDLIEPPAGRTFALFLDRRLTVMDWDWLEADADLVSPTGWEDRFDEKIWPRSSM